MDELSYFSFLIEPIINTLRHKLMIGEQAVLQEVLLMNRVDGAQEEFNLVS
jgi:hypothetical protein